MTAELSACSDMPLVEYDESEEWTLEDDDIIQASLFVVHHQLSLLV